MVVATAAEIFLVTSGGSLGGGRLVSRFRNLFAGFLFLKPKQKQETVEPVSISIRRSNQQFLGTLGRQQTQIS